MVHPISQNYAVIFWFRQDLRLADNPALTKAVQAGQVLPVYILDDETAGAHAMGAASRVWLHHSLLKLNQALQGKLALFKGKADLILERLVANHPIKQIYYNRCYEPWHIARDAKIKTALEAKGVACHSFNASLLWEPWEIAKTNGGAYQVFTPFYTKGCLQAPAPRVPLPAPKNINLAAVPDQALPLDALGLLPKYVWGKSIMASWQAGEKAAYDVLYQFLRNGLTHYAQGRDMPAEPYVSRLSPYLHFGEISPNQVWYAAKNYADNVSANGLESFLKELGWREFSYYLLYHFPQLPDQNWQKKFDKFPWRNDGTALRRWQQGQTGIPIIDAGMRQLWQTGYMHNRVRMVTASFLVKNLMIDWRHGAQWFWDCLLDADLANNSASWQWVAGCGADAAPYFRIFNPITQAQKFDAEGKYIRQFVPEIAALPNRYLFAPWLAPQAILQQAGIVLGKTYPAPIIDLAASRARALSAFQGVKLLQDSGK